MTMELIFFPHCPFGQRSRITAIHNGLPHRITHVDPDHLPEWIKEVSPLGKVPVARIEGEKGAIFESSVINELIDQLGNNDLLPADPVQRARARAWIEFGSTCQGHFGDLLKAKNEKAFNKATQVLMENLAHLEPEIGEGSDYFLGDRFSLVDSTYAPLFTRLEYLDNTIPCFPREDFPGLARWSANLCQLPEVIASVDDDLPGVFAQLVSKVGPKGYVATTMGQ